MIKKFFALMLASAMLCLPVGCSKETNNQATVFNEQSSMATVPQTETGRETDVSQGTAQGTAETETTAQQIESTGAPTEKELEFMCKIFDSIVLCAGTDAASVHKASDEDYSHILMYYVINNYGEGIDGVEISDNYSKMIIDVETMDSVFQVCFAGSDAFQEGQKDAGKFMYDLELDKYILTDLSDRGMQPMPKVRSVEKNTKKAYDEYKVVVDFYGMEEEVIEYTFDFYLVENSSDTTGKYPWSVINAVYAD